MDEPFLLSNLIDLQDLDNEIFKLIAEKSEGESVNILKELEINYHENNSLLNKKKEELLSCVVRVFIDSEDINNIRCL